MDKIPFQQPRRKDRAVEDELWIVDMLRRSPIGVLATSHNGQPYINTRHFVFDEAARAIYMHGAKVGRMRTEIESNDRVCFSVSEIGRQLPASKAFDFGCEYSGVVVFGTAKVVENAEEARRALVLILEKYFPHLAYGEDYAPIADKELAATAVFRVAIDEWSGKRKEAPVDSPGAFLFGHAPF